MSKDILVNGAREHNLKNVSVKIPREQLVVITGLSGSGKSSLAFDTIYAEGQRRYVESLSAYARQFLGQLEKPDVDSIEGLSPAISIEQKTTHRNPRSTVGTVTEIYDYIRLIFARIGSPHCPNGHGKLEAMPIDSIVDQILTLTKRHPRHSSIRLLIMSPLVKLKKGEFKDLFQKLLKEGFVRARIDGEIFHLEDNDFKLTKNKKHTIELIIDRLVLRPGSEAELRSRIAESMELALKKGDDQAIVFFEAKGEGIEDVTGEEFFSAKLSCSTCDFAFPELTHRLFSFNSPDGACPSCSGLGATLTFHPDLLIHFPENSIKEGIIKGLGWSADGYWYQNTMEALSKKLKFSLDTPWKKLTKRVKDKILHGDPNLKLRHEWQSADSEYYFNRYYEGIIPNLMRRYQQTNSDSARASMEQYMVNMKCHECNGGRLRTESLNVFLTDKNIHAVTQFSIEEALKFFSEIKLTETERLIAAQALKEILSRLKFLNDVGVGYLTLDRTAGTLSGGESQRIRLATQIGSALMGVLYVLDEPSIGLHQSDNERLIETLKGLRDLGNSILVVEHDEETIENADYIVDMGPGAGEYGGEVVFSGTFQQMLKSEKSVTGKFISGEEKIIIPKKRREGNGKFIEVIGAKHNNLKNVDVKFSLGTFTCVTGLSGSGKSSLVNEILYKALAQELHGSHKLPGEHKKISGADQIDKIINIDQSPIGRTPRSNPATYTGAFTPIRELFSALPSSKMHGYKPGRFSFNVKGGRCEACEGDGVKRIEMHFLSDVYVTCEVCDGSRFNRETLEIRYKNKSISDILNMPVSEAVDFFEAIPSIYNKVKAMFDVGLGYIKLGQPATTLSGGEAQRVKLATELSKRSNGKTIYILDEPTTGLHFEDIRQLLTVLQRFVNEGNTVIIIEHNMDVIKTSDHIVDLGPQGGIGGGEILATGTPEEIVKNKKSITGKFLKKWLRPT